MPLRKAASFSVKVKAYDFLHHPVQSLFTSVLVESNDEDDRSTDEQQNSKNSKKGLNSYLSSEFNTLS